MKQDLLIGDRSMENSAPPLISVIMPVYNSKKYLHAAVESIFGQTLADFELIAIDDGSTDGSAAILESFQQNDTRLVIQRHTQNQGIPAALNSGLALASGKYIARMDADDISRPDRFQKQVAFLETHPEIDVLGSAVQLVDERGHVIGRLSLPCEDLAIHWKSLFSAPFVHPTVMLRHSIRLEHNLRYSAAREQAEDYKFFTQLLGYAHGANSAEPLLLYRIHPGSITSQFDREKINRKSMLILTNLQKHFPALSISHDQVLLVSNALIGNSSSYWERANAADTYLQVWQAFSEGCLPDQAFYRLQNEVALIAAKLALYPPFQRGLWKALRRIYEIKPDWLASFVRRFPGMISTKIHAHLIRIKRK
jgi:glycosyltransferase involved in cell wall biosynthesis